MQLKLNSFELDLSTRHFYAGTAANGLHITRTSFMRPSTWLEADGTRCFIFLGLRVVCPK